MLSEVLTWASIVIVAWVVNIFPVCLVIRVMLNAVVGIVGEEQTVPSACFLRFSILLVAVGLIMLVEGSLISDVLAFLSNHSWEGAKVGTHLPWIVLLTS